MLQWKVCTCVHVLLLHTMFVLEVPSCSMDVYSVIQYSIVIQCVHTFCPCYVVHCTPHGITLYSTLYITFYKILYVTLCITCNIHPSGVIIVCISLSQRAHLPTILLNPMVTTSLGLSIKEDISRKVCHPCLTTSHLCHVKFIYPVHVMYSFVHMYAKQRHVVEGT